jgi:hypothetical protein
MPGFNGSGTYVRRYSWSADQANGLPISATKFDNSENDVAGAFNICLTRDNQGTPSAPLIWSQALTLNQSSDGTNFVFARTGGTNNPTLTASVIDAGGVVKLNITGTTAQLQVFTQGALAFTLSAAQVATFASNVLVGGTFSVTGNVITPLNVTGNAQTPVVNIGNSGTAFTLNCALSNTFRVLMNGNVATLTISNPSDGQTVVLKLTQDGTGTRTMAWPAALKWAGGVALALSTPAASVDLLVMTYYADTGFWYATLTKAMA